MNKYNDIVKRDMIWGTYLLFLFFAEGWGVTTFRLLPNNNFI